MKNVFLRKRQFELAEHSAFCPSVARQLVAAKIRNQRTLLRRNHLEPPTVVLRQVKQYADLAMAAEQVDELLGIEGNAARVYFTHFSGMLKANDDTLTWIWLSSSRGVTVVHPPIRSMPCCRSPVAC